MLRGPAFFFFGYVCRESRYVHSFGRSLYLSWSLSLVCSFRRALYVVSLCRSLCHALVMRLSIAIQLVEVSPVIGTFTRSSPGKAIQASPWPPGSCQREQ